MYRMYFVALSVSLFFFQSFQSDDFSNIPFGLILVDDRICKPCKEPDTYEGILHNYCKADYGRS